MALDAIAAIALGEGEMMLDVFTRARAPSPPPLSPPAPPNSPVATPPTTNTVAAAAALPSLRLPSTVSTEKAVDKNNAMAASTWRGSAREDRGRGLAAVLHGGVLPFHDDTQQQS